MSGIYFNNYTGSEAPIGNVINFVDSPIEIGTFNSISLTDSDLLKQSFISFTTNDPVPSLEFSELTFINVRKYVFRLLINKVNIAFLFISTYFLN